jgi:hypothetical protein
MRSVSSNIYSFKFISIKRNAVKAKYMGSRAIAINSIQLFITYVQSQQVQGQSETQDSAVISNYIIDKSNIKSSVKYSNTLMKKKQTISM